MNCSGELLLILQHLAPLLEGNTWVCVDIQPANNSDDFSFTCPKTVHTTEIHNIVIVEDALPSVINSLECFHVIPVHSTLQIVLELFQIHVVLDFVLEKQGDLLFNSEAEAHTSRAVVTRSLSDHRAHVQIITRQQDFHPPMQLFKSESIYIAKEMFVTYSL